MLALAIKVKTAVNHCVKSVGGQCPTPRKNYYSHPRFALSLYLEQLLKSEPLHFPRHNFITAEEQKYLITNLLALQLLGHLMRKKGLFQIQD